MEQNLPIITKKIWNLMRVAFYMLKKSINKKKILLDLNLFIKRGKLVAGKTLTNLLFHNHNVSMFDNCEEYEFSCTNTPLYRHYFTNNNNNNNKRSNNKINHQPKKSIGQDVNNMWEMMMALSSDATAYKSPTVRQLNVTDSPYLSQNEVMQVDEAAEEFIKRFYSELKQQTC